MSSFSQSTNSSATSPVETTENGLIDQLSGVAAGLAQQMNQWAQQTFAQTSAVTDQTVNNFFQASQQMMGLAGNMTNQYNNLFAPENAQLVQDANDYASPEHMAVDMGAAGATQAQAGAAGIQNSEENLVGMGIDPSSGRYAALDKAAAVQNAANIAGAENTQRNADISTGQQLRAEAVQVGAQLPSAISNATNTAIQANTGAENASLGNANTGANLQALADKYLQTAMGIKLPLSQSRSTGQSSGNSQKPEQSGSGGSGNGQGAGGGQGSSGAAWMPQHGSAAGNDGGSGGGRGGGQPSSKITQLPGQPDAQTSNVGGGFGTGDEPSQSWAGSDFGQNDIYQPGGSMDIGQAGSADDGINYQDEGGFGDSGFGQTLDPESQIGGGYADGTFGNMSGGTDTEFGNISYDQSQNQTSDYSGYGDYSQPDTTVYDNGGGGSAFQDYGYTSPDMSGSSGGDYSGGSDDDDEGYAGGGAVAPATTGGAVSPQMSPSGGQQTDDVRANLNSGEFVIPKDVARWKGEEFMHNLIAQSRQKRVKMQQALGTGGKPMPAGDPRARQQPSFNSRPMGAR